MMMDVPGQHKKKAILPTNEDLGKINTNDGRMVGFGAG